VPRVSGGSGAAVVYKENGGGGGDTAPSWPCNKRGLRPGYRSKGALRETNIITGNTCVCVCVCMCVFKKASR